MDFTKNKFLPIARLCLVDLWICHLNTRNVATFMVTHFLPFFISLYLLDLAYSTTLEFNCISSLCFAASECNKFRFTQQQSGMSLTFPLPAIW